MSQQPPTSAWSRFENWLLYGLDRLAHLLSGAPRNLQSSRWIGKTVLIGLSYEDETGHIHRREQLWGEIASVDPHSGFTIQLKGAYAGYTYPLPPEPRGLKVARRGEYRLKATGELLVDPDFVSTWVVSALDEDTAAPADRPTG